MLRKATIWLAGHHLHSPAWSLLLLTLLGQTRVVSSISHVLVKARLTRQAVLSSILATFSSTTLASIGDHFHILQFRYPLLQLLTSQVLVRHLQHGCIRLRSCTVHLRKANVYVPVAFMIELALLILDYVYQLLHHFQTIFPHNYLSRFEQDQRMCHDLQVRRLLLNGELIRASQRSGLESKQR